MQHAVGISPILLGNWRKRQQIDALLCLTGKGLVLEGDVVCLRIQERLCSCYFHLISLACATIDEQQTSDTAKPLAASKCLHTATLLHLSDIRSFACHLSTTASLLPHDSRCEIVKGTPCTVCVGAVPADKVWQGIVRNSRYITSCIPAETAGRVAMEQACISYVGGCRHRYRVFQ